MKKITIGVAAILMATLPLLADIQMTPDGTWVDGKPQMTPDGEYVGSGKIEMTPNGNYIAVKPTKDEDESSYHKYEDDKEE